LGAGLSPPRLRASAKGGSSLSTAFLSPAVLETIRSYFAPPEGKASAPFPVERNVIRVLLADDHEILRAGIASLLTSARGIQVVGEAGDGARAVELATELEPDVVVMDVTMPKMNGIEATEQIVSSLPNVRVIGLSMHSESDMAQAMQRAGASAYVTKGGAAIDLIDAIRKYGQPTASAAS
jgi:CheY-like chemotaxis protein